MLHSICAYLILNYRIYKKYQHFHNLKPFHFTPKIFDMFVKKQHIFIHQKWCYSFCIIFCSSLTLMNRGIPNKIFAFIFSHLESKRRRWILIIQNRLIQPQIKNLKVRHKALERLTTKTRIKALSTKLWRLSLKIEVY